MELNFPKRFILLCLDPQLLLRAFALLQNEGISLFLTS